MYKFKNKIMTLATFSIFAVVAPQNSYAFCFFNCPPAVDKKPEEAVKLENTIQESLQGQNSEQILRDLNTRMSAAFEEINNRLQNNDSDGALSQAKSILDEVKVKTGIDPKAKLQKSYLVSEDFPEKAVRFTDLSTPQQERIIGSLIQFQGGLFMDILNLTKRTTLLYIKALTSVLSKNSGLLQADKNKIINDLIRAAVLPIPLQDKKGTRVIAFSDDIAIEDHIYLFNRELKLHLMNMNELGVSESQFDQLIQGFKQNMKVGNTSNVNSSTENIFADPEFIACYKVYDITWTSADTTNACITKVQDKGYRFYTSKKFSQCYAYYDITYTSADAAERCEEYIITNK